MTSEAAPAETAKPVDAIGDFKNSIKGSITRARLAGIDLSVLVKAANTEFVGAFASSLASDPTDAVAVNAICVLTSTNEEL